MVTDRLIGIMPTSVQVPPGRAHPIKCTVLCATSLTPLPPQVVLSGVAGQDLEDGDLSTTPSPAEQVPAHMP